jgi:hypothetical protein
MIFTLKFVTSDEPLTVLRCVVTIGLVVLLLSIGRYFLSDDE